MQPAVRERVLPGEFSVKWPVVLLGGREAGCCNALRAHAAFAGMKEPVLRCYIHPAKGCGTVAVPGYVGAHDGVSLRFTPNIVCCSLLSPRSCSTVRVKRANAAA